MTKAAKKSGIKYFEVEVKEFKKLEAKLETGVKRIEKNLEEEKKKNEEMYFDSIIGKIAQIEGKIEDYKKMNS